jgi:hypothetical protein
VRHSASRQDEERGAGNRSAIRQHRNRTASRRARVRICRVATNPSSGTVQGDLAHVLSVVAIPCKRSPDRRHRHGDRLRGPQHRRVRITKKTSLVSSEPVPRPTGSCESDREDREFRAKIAPLITFAMQMRVSVALHEVCQIGLLAVVGKIHDPIVGSDSGINSHLEYGVI